MSQNKDFTTQDLNLSAVLISKGFELEKVSKNLNGKSTFYFFKSEDLEKTIRRYWNNKLLINPQELFNALKLLKNRIYSNY